MAEKDKKDSPTSADRPADHSPTKSQPDLTSTFAKVVEELARSQEALKSLTENPFAEFVKNMEKTQKAVQSLATLDPLATLKSSIGIGSFLIHDEQARKHQRRLEEEIAALHRKVEEQTGALRREQSTAAERGKRIKNLEETLLELNQKERLGFLLGRINQDGQHLLLQSTEFQDLFLGQRESASFVVSIDIRRSTELMLKARSPEAFASFITDLCTELMDIMKQSYGVIDKFTGDGVLAFFPEFYSGKDAAYYAISAADKCHAAFKHHYEGRRKSFKSILIDVGLGIGIDFGKVHLVQIAGGLTVVGEPVVYACRLSGAPAGVTLLNQPAYEDVMDKFSAYCSLNETFLEIKHEGRMLAYEVNVNSKIYSPTIPEWVGRTGPNAES